ncbi:MAG: PQQ-binding-like beta-propeller repeat protein [Chitinophagaceae bacterium]|nr:PQQ-binding-like beta-propeller repeat protein [Chitinophagaceae bacterium]
MKNAPEHKLLMPFLLSIFLLPSLSGCKLTGDKNDKMWGEYRNEGTNAYSGLKEINKQNVKQLKVAWTYRTGDKTDYVSLECNPLIINNILYGLSPRLKAFALDAETGKELWVFNPFGKESKEGGFNRGLTYWKSGDDERLFMFPANKMISIDAKTGKQMMSFGDSGYVDLNENLRSHKGLNLQENVENTSPAVIYKDLIIVGSSVGEDYENSPGHIRAYNARTGKMQWIFHTVPQPGERGYDTWPKDAYKTAGGCNAWAGLSIDRNKGIVFAATGSPSFDFHGGERLGKNLFGNSVIAIDAATGKYIWHYQVVHHDLWDYDLPSPPNLVTVKKDGKTIDAVAQITKQGYIFLLDRASGVPLFPVEEKKVAASTMPYEESWPTQPVPTKPVPLCRQKFDERAITDISPEARDYVLNEAKKYDWGDIYLPPSTKGIIQMPGYRGGAEWSGACVDKETGIMYVGINDIPNITQLLEKQDANTENLDNVPFNKAGEILYTRTCAACHGNDRKGNTSFPPLLNIEQRLNPHDVKTTMENGRGMMPGFRGMDEQDKEAIIAFLFNSENKRVYKKKNKDGDAIAGKEKKMRYRLRDYIQLLDQNGYPGTKPPWGTLNAVDLNTGEIIWKKPLGEYPELTKKGITNTGTQLFGGGIVTAGGLIFIGASKDEKFRAIDKLTGKTLWEFQLPAGGYATPATYEVDGKQYVVIAAGGGGRQRTKTGDYYIAFALP